MNKEHEEIRRPIVLYVDEVMEARLNIEHLGRPPKRYVRLEMAMGEAIKMRADLNQQIERNLPGAVSVVCKGHLTI